MSSCIISLSYSHVRHDMLSENATTQNTPHNNATSDGLSAQLLPRHVVCAGLAPLQLEEEVYEDALPGLGRDAKDLEDAEGVEDGNDDDEEVSEQSLSGECTSSKVYGN